MSMTWYRRIPLVLVVLGMAGLAVSAYLTISHWGDKPLVCAGIADCGLVNASEYASIGGIPVSMLGAGLYLAMLSVALVWVRSGKHDWLPVAYWGLALAGTGYAGYLTYVELAILHAICIWCVISAILLTLSLVLASIAVFFEPEEEREAALLEKGGLGTTRAQELT